VNDPAPIGLAPPLPPPVRVLGVEEFAGLRTAWDTAALAGPSAAPFVLHGWLTARIHALPRGARPVILVAGEGDGVDAGLALAIERRGPLRVARLLSGDRVSHADAIGPDGPAVEAVVRALRDLDCDVISLTGLLAASRIVRHGHLHLTRRVTSPLLRLDEGFAEVVGRRLTRHDRHDIRRRRRRLAELGTVSVERDATPAEVAAGLPDVFRLHALRWASAPDRSDLRTPADQAFQREMSTALAADGRFLLHRLCLDGVAIAFRSTLLAGDRAFAYRMAFDPAYAFYAPGRLLTHDVFTELSDAGIREIEMMGGDFEHKRTLTDVAPWLYSAIGRGAGRAGMVAAPALAGAVDLRVRAKRSPRLRQVHERLLAVRQGGRR
jgi:CelD/BcsL family acetyltransferase involved in cellulose biosynthesis